MKEVFQINKKHQIKSISEGLMLLLGIPISIAVAYFFGYTELLLEATFVNAFLIFYLILFLPAFILHFSYYLENRNTRLEIDSEINSFTIQNAKGEIVLTSDKIEQVILVVYTDFRWPTGFQRGIPVPWRNYGNLKIITKDDKVILLTSLMLDPLNPPIKPTKTEFRLVPFLDRSLEKELTQEEIASQIRLEVEEYKEKFQYLSEEELQRKLVVNGYMKEAVIAAEEILKERNTVSNKV